MSITKSTDTQVGAVVQVVESLVAALLRADGDALVMHVGEQPSVLTAAGPTVLTSGEMTLTSMADLLREILPIDAQHALEEFGAVEADLPPTEAGANERLTVVAARGGDDIWIEIRRQRLLPFDLAAPPVHRELHAQRPAESGDTPERPFAPAGKPFEPSGPVSAASAHGSTVSSRPHEFPAVVLPLSRSHVRPDATVRQAPPPRLAGLDRLLRVAAARGAETLYLSSQSRPSIRVEGEIIVLDGESPLTAAEIETLMLDVMADRGHEPDAAEWLVDLPDIGRVRCVSFRDHRGPGGVFRIIPARVVTAEQLGLSREIQSLCTEPEGLVLVAGPRSSGKSTLIAAFVDQINRTRGDHVITIENRVKVVHESRMALVSQREVRGDTDALVGAIRAALRESPDVLVIEDLRTPEVVAEALAAAAAGHLVIGGIAAHGATTALERIVEQTPSERRGAIQALLAESLRGVVGQVLLRKAGGGRVAARELMLNSPSIAQILLEGKLSQLPLAVESGRRAGMVPLVDALVAFVQSGVVDVREAWRKAGDRHDLLKALKREGIDTSFTERLA
jgi:twitching motility protein PilT